MLGVISVRTGDAQARAQTAMRPYTGHFDAVYAPGSRALPAASADGCAKAGRFNTAGRSYHGIEPSLSAYFGGANASVAAELAAAAAVPPAGPDGADDDDEQEGTCHAQLRCAREAAAPSGGVNAPMACHGVTGFVCQHGVPLLGTFVLMHAPEQFAYYRVGFDELSRAGVSLCDSYVDFGCILGGNWRRLRPGAAWPADFLVPWLHARSHGPHCHLRFSGMYAPGAPSWQCCWGWGHAGHMGCSICGLHIWDWGGE